MEKISSVKLISGYYGNDIELIKRVEVDGKTWTTVTRKQNTTLTGVNTPVKASLNVPDDRTEFEVLWKAKGDQLAKLKMSNPAKYKRLFAEFLERKKVKPNTNQNP